MSGDVWSWGNLVDETNTSVTATLGSDGQLFVSRLKDQRVGKIWRAAAAGAGRIDVQFTSPQPVGVVGIFNANLTDQTSVELRVGSAVGGGDLATFVVDLALNRNGHAVGIVRDADGEPVDVSANAVSVAYDGPVALQAGRVWAGPVSFAPAVNHIYGESSWQGFDYSARNLTPRNGAFLIDRADRKRAFTATYDALYPDEYDQILYELDTTVGRSAQMLFIPDPSVYPTERWPILGYLREQEETNFAGFLRGGRALSILEAG